LIFREAKLQVLKSPKKKNQLNSGGNISRVHYSRGKHGKHNLRFWCAPSQGPLCGVQHKDFFFLEWWLREFVYNYKTRDRMGYKC